MPDAADAAAAATTTTTTTPPSRPPAAAAFPAAPATPAAAASAASAAVTAESTFPASEDVKDSSGTAPTTTTTDPTQSDTPIHYPRFFLYLALLLIPVLFELTYLSSPTVFKATLPQSSSSSSSSSTDTTAYTATIGLFQLCAGGADCVSVAGVCAAAAAATGSGARVDGVPRAVVDGVCGAGNRAAAAMGVIAAVAGAGGLAVYAYTLLVWSHHSLLLHPWLTPPRTAHHLLQRLTRIVLIHLLLHLLLTAGSLAASFSVRGAMLGSSSSTGLSVDPFWGVWVSVAAAGADAAFLGLFAGVGGKATFFAVPKGAKFDPIMERV